MPLRPTVRRPALATLIAHAGTFAIPTGVTTIHVAITPVAAAAAPAAGQVSGNVYRVEVTDSSGQPIPIAGARRPTLAMRAAGDTVSSPLRGS